MPYTTPITTPERDAVRADAAHYARKIAETRAYLARTDIPPSQRAGAQVQLEWYISMRRRLLTWLRG